MNKSLKWACVIGVVLLASGVGVYAQPNASSGTQPPPIPPSLKQAYPGSGYQWVDLQIPGGEPVDGIVIERCRAVGNGNDQFGQVAEWDIQNGGIIRGPYQQIGNTWWTVLTLTPQKKLCDRCWIHSC